MVFFDVEATGLTGSKITELSFVAVHKSDFGDYHTRLKKYFQVRDTVQNGGNRLAEPSLPRVMNRLTLAVCPRRPILPHVEELTGLSNYNLEHQAAWSEGVGSAVTAFLSLLARPVCLVAHNGIRFDYPLLKRELQAVSIEMDADLLVCDSWHFFLHFYTGEMVSSSPLSALSRSPARPRFSTPERNGNSRASPAHTPKKHVTLEPSPFLTPPPSARKRQINSEGLLHLRKKLITQEEFREHSVLESVRTDLECCASLDEVEEDERKEEEEDDMEEQAVGLFAGYERYCRQMKDPPPKYSLSQIFRHIFGRDPAVSHGAEADCLSLLQVVAVCGPAFTSWLSSSALLFRDVATKM